MCRIAAYLGSEITLGRFLLEPPHSLYRQSWEPKEMEDAALNADGFGVGWLDPENKLATYINTQPIWADTNLTNLSASLKSCCWLANVRSATPGQAITQTNTHPFNLDGLLFTHNGYIENFNPNIKTIFHEILEPSIQAGIQGNTDSEFIFALLRQHLKTEKDLAKATQNMLTELTDIVAGGKALINIVMTDGPQFIVVRHAINGQCPTLYFSHDEADYPDAILIASEKLNTSGKWQTVPEHSLTKITDNSVPDFISI